MANELLTDQKITRKALAILHDNLNFIGNINRQYDSQFAQSGAKIGTQLRVRLPNEYTVRTGRKHSAQTANEQAETITVANQYGVDMSFYSDELTLSVDDFAERHLKPAMSVLASYLEYKAMDTMVLDVANSVGTPNTQPSTLASALAVKRKMDEFLAPDDGNRYLLVNSACMASMVNGLSGLYHAGQEIAHQYRKGFILENSGFKWFTNNMIPVLTQGSQDETTPLVNGANQEGSSLAIDGGDTTSTIKKGQVITISGVYAVHPETKQAYGFLKQFVVTADLTLSAGAGTLSISPSIISTGAKQNVSAVPADDATVTLLSAGSASTAYPVNIGFHRDSFAAVFADLEMPKGTDMAYRATMDGISLRFIRDYDSKEDEWISRFDVLCGFKTLRASTACRLWGKSE